MTIRVFAAFPIIPALIAASLTPVSARAQGIVPVGVPAKAGAVNGTKEDSDAFIWRLITEFAAPVSAGKPSPVVFETWATDEDTFSKKPHWPTPGEPLKLHASVLPAVRTLNNPGTANLHAAAIDVPCSPPVGAAVGGFPVGGTPVACVAEQVGRNRPQYDYIVKNNLNTKAGLAAAYAKSFKVAMPADAISVKGDWVPVAILLRWIPALGDIANIRKLYFTDTANSVEYALVSMHISSRQNPNWVWGTLEHQKNPGRCDYIGCFDTFGAQIPAVFPNRKAVNTQYGPCLKTQRLKTMMEKANLSPVLENYCLKTTEVDYTAADGTPYVLGNSVIEGIVGNGTIAASSCIACHVYASFGPKGSPSASATAILPFNPTGSPNQGVLAGSLQFDFMWGVLLAP